MTAKPSPEREDWRERGPDEAVFLPYQQRWVADNSAVKVIEKSRRVGITWAEAGDDVLAAADGTDDTWYIGYSEDQALEFVRDCEWWARTFKMVETAVEGMDADVWFDQDGIELDPTATDEKSIQAFRIRFHSGKRITALSSRPRNLRGKQGRVVLDEFAFHENKRELIKAAIALLMWGGKVRIISTHDGVDNEFNELIEEIRAQNARHERGELDKQGQPVKRHSYHLHRVTLDDALEEGLFKRRVRLVRDEWAARAAEVGLQQAQDEWRQWLIDSYGMGADEELFCVPTQLGAGDYFDPEWFPVVSSLSELPGRVTPVRVVRCWDWAATKPNKHTPDPDWTRGGLWMVLSNGQYAIADMASLRDGPAEVNALLKRMAALDGREVEVAQPQDPAAAGKADALAKEKALLGYRVHTVRMSTNKEAYARVWSPIAKRGDIIILKGGDPTWVKPFLRELQAFPGGKHDDQVDTGNLFFEVVFSTSSWDGKDGYEGGGDDRHPEATGTRVRTFMERSEAPPDEGDDPFGDGVGSGGRFGCF